MKVQNVSSEKFRYAVTGTVDSHKIIWKKSHSLAITERARAFDVPALGFIACLIITQSASFDIGDNEKPRRFLEDGAERILIFDF